MKVVASDFVVRQTRISDFSYYSGPWEDVEKLAVDLFDAARDGYRDGVKLIAVPAGGFYSALVSKTDDMEPITIFEARREGEEPYKKTVIYGVKEKANFVDLVIYRKDVLEEDSDFKGTGADWEIVSINARVDEEEAPIPPQTMARNQLADVPEHGVGGTKADYPVKDFIKSIDFWKTHCLIREKGEANEETPIYVSDEDLGLIPVNVGVGVPAKPANMAQTHTDGEITYTSGEFARSIVFWNTHTLVEE